MASVRLDGVTKLFGEYPAVQRVSLDMADGEFVALLGPSGCGKTTLLRLLAGFERLDEGTIAFDDLTVAAPGHHLPAERRRVGMVFQSYALWPHMSVAENVGYPLRVAKLPTAERERKVALALGQVGMEAYAARRPAALSGGQRQRVALARCLAMESGLVLLDEPLANLDVHLRESMQAEFRAFHAATDATMVYVTHDQAEAMALADRVIVMDHGVVQQAAPPRDLYRCPATAMVAGFVGRGMLRRGQVLGPDGPGRCRATLCGATISVRADDATPGPADICLRAEHLEFASEGPGTMPAVVEDSIYRGPVTSVRVRPRGEDPKVPPLVLEVTGEPPAAGAVAHIAARDAWRIPGLPTA